MDVQNNNSNLSKFQYNNLLDTIPDQNHEKIITYRQNTQASILMKNFKVLEQFLKTFKAQQNNREIAELPSSSQFKEQWQSKRKEKYQLKYSYFFRQNFLYLPFSLILLISQIVLLWLLSVFRVFKCQDNKFIFELCFVIQVLDLILKSSYLLISRLKQENQNLFEIKFKDWIEIYMGNLYCIIYSIMGISSIVSQVSNQAFLILDVVAIGFNYYRMESIQNDIKMIKSSVEFKNYIKLFNLMSTLIMIIHFFAVLMHYSTNFTHQNYLSNEQIGAQKTWINIYIYSFYFSGTTVLTVGYGDILPKNIIEIFIVLLMQIFGVVMIVYLNGEVGNILCSLRREKENLENDLSVLERLKSSFKLSLQTTQKIRQFLIDNRRADEENNIHEEKALLEKISSGLREEATLTNHVNIIKQSLFLLSNFSTKAHISISNKLISRIYSPNECINQMVGNERLFFIKKGEICFYINKKENQNYNSRKIVKRILVSKDEKAECNCFGYVSLIMGKQNRLKAYSKDFSDCYSIEKNQFLEAINCDNQDFEKFHEMRESYISDKNPEKNEAQNFFNEKDHFVCEVSKVIADYLKERYNSKRKNKLRMFKKRKLIIEVTKGDNNISGTESQSELGSVSVRRLDLKESKGQNLCLSIKERNKKYEQLNNESLKGSTSKNLIVQRKYNKRHIKKKNTQQQNDSNRNMGKKLELSDPFQIGVSLAYFYPDSNIDMVMRKINYYLKVLSIFTNMFERTLERVNKGKEQNQANGENVLGSITNIEKYRRQKDFIETINIKL